MKIIHLSCLVQFPAILNMKIQSSWLYCVFYNMICFHISSQCFCQLFVIFQWPSWQIFPPPPNGIVYYSLFVVYYFFISLLLCCLLGRSNTPLSSGSTPGFSARRSFLMVPEYHAVPKISLEPPECKIFTLAQ